MTNCSEKERKDQKGLSLSLLTLRSVTDPWPVLGLETISLYSLLRVGTYCVSIFFSVTPGDKISRRRVTEGLKTYRQLPSLFTKDEKFRTNCLVRRTDSISSYWSYLSVYTTQPPHLNNTVLHMTYRIGSVSTSTWTILCKGTDLRKKDLDNE